MTHIIIAILFVGFVAFLFQEKQKIKPQKYTYVFFSIIKGVVLYGLFGYLIAYVILLMKDSHHPHSMIGLLYVFLPLFGAGFGSLVSVANLLFFKKNINTILLYFLPVYPLLLLLFVLLF